jgi:hypothetical protein
VKRYQAGLPELGSPDREEIFGPIDVSDTEVERLTQSKACDCQQPKQAVVGPGAQRVNRRSRFGRVQQFSDFLMGIEVWLSPLRPKRQKTERRNFC